MILIFTCRQDRRAPWSCCRRHTGGPDQYKMSINRKLTNQRPAFCLFVCYYLNGDTLNKPQAHEHRQPLDKVETNPNEALEEARIRTRFWMFNCELHSRISSWYYVHSTEKYIIRITRNPFAYIFFLPELAWEKM